jgi:cytochrome c biogenesis factor
MVRLLRGSTASSGLTLSRRRRIGAAVVHFSVVVLFLGFIGGAYTLENAELLGPNQSMRVGDYHITYLGFRDSTDYMKTARFAHLHVKKGADPVGGFTAARFVYHSHPKQPTNEVTIHTTIKEDLFLTLGNTDDQTGAAMIRVLVNPLVVWIWIGGGLLVLGALVGLSPRIRITASRGDVVRRLLRFGFPVVASVSVLSAAWILKGIVMAVAAGIGIGLIGMMLLFGQSLFALTEEEGR